MGARYEAKKVEKDKDKQRASTSEAEVSDKAASSSSASWQPPGSSLPSDATDTTTVDVEEESFASSSAGVRTSDSSLSNRVRVGRWGLGNSNGSSSRSFDTMADVTGSRLTTSLVTHESLSAESVGSMEAPKEHNTY